VPPQVYHLKSTSAERTSVDVYNTKDGSLQLHKVGEKELTPPGVDITAARVFFRTSDQSLGFNPPYPLPEGCEVTLHKPHRVQDLLWDPGEWIWTPEVGRPNISFLNYQTKLGYRIVIKAKTKPSKYDTQLSAKGFSEQERKQIYDRLWHPWLPKKVSMFMWMLHNAGLPLGSWLNQMDIEEECKLCYLAPLETTRHAFIDCEEVREAWVHFNNLRAVHNLPRLQFTPADILEGRILARPGSC